MAPKSKRAESAEDRANRCLARNRKARHDYHIEETLETGISLLGSEVKSAREGKVSLGEAYAEIRGGELWLVGATISEYPFAHQQNHEPGRRRKLLAHKHEIRKLDGRVRERGYTLVPLEIYLKAGRIKILVGLARGKRQYDRREATRRRDQARDLREQTD